IEQCKKRRRLTQQKRTPWDQSRKTAPSESAGPGSKGRPANRAKSRTSREAHEHHFIQSSSQSLLRTHQRLQTAESNLRAMDLVAAMLEANRRLRITPRQEHYRGVHF